MAIEEAKYQISWASCGYPENSRDTFIFDSTDIYTDLNSGNFPGINHQEGDTSIPPLLLGDAFPFHTWLIKPYSHATLSAKKKCSTKSA